MRGTIFGLILALAPAVLAADPMDRIADERVFLNTVAGRDLARLGISLRVLPEGDISGRAFGKDVTGNWRWRNGLFCRDLYLGQRDLGPNCQLVETDGRVIRFTADEGAGMSAEFTLR